MRTWIFVFVLTAIQAFSSGASAQASAEAALAHSMSSAAGTAMGTTLGRATNQMAGRVGQQTANTVQPRVTTVKPGLQRHTKFPRAMAASGTHPSSGLSDNGSSNHGSNHGSSNHGSMIASIQGGGPQPSTADCTLAPPAPQSGTQTGSVATGVSPVPVNSRPSSEKERSDCFKSYATRQDGNAYDSVITLPPAK